MNAPYGGGGYAPSRRVDYGWINESWRLFTQAAGTWIVLMLINLAVSFVIGLALQAAFPNPQSRAGAPPMTTPGSAAFWSAIASSQELSSVGQIFSYIVNLVVSAFFGACYYRLAVRQVRGETGGIGDMFAGAPYFHQMLLATFLLGLLYLAGALVFCLGMFVAFGLMLPAQAMVADGAPAGEAISRSFEAMKSDWLNAALFYLILTLFTIISVIPCGLGLLAMFPMLTIISALAYRDMGGMPMNPPFAPVYGDPQPGVWPPPPASGGQPGQWPPPQGGQPGQWPPPP